MVVTVITGRSGKVARPPSAVSVLNLGVLRQLQALDGGLALLCNVADNVSDGIGLILEVAISNISEAGGGQALVCVMCTGQSLDQTLFRG